MNYTNVIACGSPGAGSRQGRAAVPGRLGLCRWRSSAGGAAEAGAARALHPRKGASLGPEQPCCCCSIGSCLLLAQHCRCPARSAVPAAPRTPTQPLGHTHASLTQPAQPQLWDFFAGCGGSLFLLFWWEDGAASGNVSYPGGRRCTSEHPLLRQQPRAEGGGVRGRAENGAGLSRAELLTGPD